MWRCRYRHNMRCNCRKVKKNLKSYDDIMALDSSQARIDELNTAPVEYYNKLNWEWHIINNTLEWDWWVVRDPEFEVWGMWEK